MWFAAQEEELKGSRLRYRKIYGNGPEMGWISCSDKNDENDVLVIQKKHMSWSESPLIAYDYDLPPFFGRGRGAAADIRSGP